MGSALKRIDTFTVKFERQELLVEFLTNCITLFCHSQTLLSKASFDGSSRLDLFYHRVANNADLSKTAKKRLMERCVHVNPSEQLFWNTLKEYC